MKLLVLVTLLGAAAAFVDRDEWNNYKIAFGKKYRNAIEELHRMRVYADNKAFVARHNAEFAAGRQTFTVALNRFADMTEDEVNALYKGGAGQTSRPHGVHRPSGRQAPVSMDWRDQGVVTYVKDQGACGSCWSFAATGALESAWALAGRGLQALSEQQLVDCSTENSGCSGGMAYRAYSYVEDEGGIMSEEAYPYTARDGSSCHADSSQYVASVTSHVNVPSHGSATILRDAVADVGPIAVSIDASRHSFNLYSGGVYNDPSCSSSSHNHAVLVVGYGTENGHDYWLVKNSWGPEWGDSGYIKMTRDDTNQCAIASIPVYPVV
ncbi:Digestive cysteine proteinase 2 [Amphibalanus amphitrite]|uniref:Digestive cysteine proteinase 2 n=1 Tax=Amphibalanus amphitrite TaxID=1232801 RepID=A0A6A4UY23_AMPAM|nr:Digestive cysteine proteinase 2 [Amphibalanus amphitrite]